MTGNNNKRQIYRKKRAKKQKLIQPPLGSPSLVQVIFAVGNNKIIREQSEQ